MAYGLKIVRAEHGGCVLWSNNAMIMRNILTNAAVCQGDVYECTNKNFYRGNVGSRVYALLLVFNLVIAHGSSVC